MKRINTLILSGLTGLIFSSVYSTPKNFQIDYHSTVTNEISSENKVQIALLLDTSNSMDGLINQAKAQLWDIVNEFSYVRCHNKVRPRLEIALYQYGNNDLAPREGYIQQVLGFSSDLDEISEKLFSLSTNGGEEYCGQVIHTSLRQLDWSQNRNHLRMIFIAGNEPFTQGKLNYRDAALQAREKEVVINTIFCGDYKQGIQTEWKEGAILTGGEYMSIDHNRQAVHIATPYDEIIIKLNNRLNKTYISYGAAGASKIAQQSAQDTNAMEMEEAVAVKRAVSKSSGYYRNSSWDLVDAAEQEDFDISKIDKKHLPASIQNKDDQELEMYISEKKKERKKIQEEINSLNIKREQFIKQQQEEEKGELEGAMLKAIKNQASRKNYNWEK